MLKTQNQQLKDLIAKGHLDQVLKYLTVYTQSLPDQDDYNSIIQLSARWKTNERAHSLGTLTNSDYNTERNRINQAVLDLMDALIDHIPDPEIEDKAKKKPSDLPSSTPKTDLWKKVGYIGLILGILASMVKIIEFCNKPSAASDEAMQLTVYVQGTNGQPIAELQNNGKIIVDFGNDRRAPLIGENGRTNLGEIPEKFRGKPIPIILQAEGYEPVDSANKYTMNGQPIYYLVRPDNSLGTIQGIVKDRSGEKFIEGALVMIDQETTLTTDQLGRFKVVLPVDKQRTTYTITVKKEGYKVKSEYFKPKTGAMEIRLDR